MDSFGVTFRSRLESILGLLVGPVWDPFWGHHLLPFGINFGITFRFRLGSEATTSELLRSRACAFSLESELNSNHSNLRVRISDSVGIIAFPTRLGSEILRAWHEHQRLVLSSDSALDHATSCQAESHLLWHHPGSR